MLISKLARSLGIVRKTALDAAIAEQEALKAELAAAELKAAGFDPEKLTSLEAAFKADIASGNMEFRQFDNAKDFADYILNQRTIPLRLERSLSYSVVQNAPHSEKLIGYCDACEQVQPLLIDLQWGDGTEVSFRERAVCGKCGLNTRQRFIMAYIRHACIAHTGIRIYAQEQVTDLFKALNKDYPDTIGSEYLGPDIKPGAVVDGIRHEDCLALSFEDASFDIVISNDVLEHVADLQAALAELFRVLAPGGRLIFTVPFHYDTEKTVRRAGIENGALTHYLSPEYHGNPVADEGSLVFYDIGADIFDYLHEAGFSKVQIVCADSLVRGYYGAPSLFVAVK